MLAEHEVVILAIHRSQRRRIQITSVPPRFSAYLRQAQLHPICFFFSFAMVDVELFYVFVIAIRLTVLCKHRVFQAL